MKKLTILLIAFLFGAGTFSYGQEPKVKEEKAKTETTQEKKAKKAKKQKEAADKKGNAYGKNKEVEGKEFGETRSTDASKGKKK